MAVGGIVCGSICYNTLSIIIIFLQNENDAHVLRKNTVGIIVYDLQLSPCIETYV